MGDALKFVRSRTRVVEKKTDPLKAALETIEVPRAWLHEHGVPENYAALEAEVIAHTPGFQRWNQPRQEFVWQAEQGRNVAFYRPGDEGQAYLYVQSWRGPA